VDVNGCQDAVQLALQVWMGISYINHKGGCMDESRSVEGAETLDAIAIVGTHPVASAPMACYLTECPRHECCCMPTVTD
jgi:hypothetical protein